MRPVGEFQFMDFISSRTRRSCRVLAKSELPLGRARARGAARPFRRRRARRSVPLAESRDVLRAYARAESDLPGDRYDAKGLIKSAMRDNNPVLFFEHKYLYRRVKEELPAEDYTVPIGKARIASRRQARVSVITYAAMVYVAQEAAEILAKEGIELEIIDLRTLLPLDNEAIARDRGEDEPRDRLHEDTKTGGIAGEIAAIINEEGFDALDAPIVRIASLDSPVPFSPPLEKAFLPKVEDVVREARRLMAY